MKKVVPFMLGLALVRGVLGAWQTSSIVQTRSGLPTNVQLISGFFGNPEKKRNST